MSGDQSVALALQGGGVHGAYAWGVLDRLLETGMRFDRICGVSSGALLATMLTQGMVKGGQDGARRQLRRLWDRIGQAHSLSPLQTGPLERWMWGADLSNSWAWQGMETVLRMFSPAQLNPFGHNPLRPIIGDLLDRSALAHPTAPTLTVAATDVETGEAKLWTNREITVDVLLASCCLPFVFHAVRIDGRFYWDGGYSGNPPLAPLLRPAPPTDLLLVRAQPAVRRGEPTTPAEILNRLNEIACHGVLEAELAVLPDSIRVTTFEADATLGHLAPSTKFNADEFLAQLFAAGRATGAKYRPHAPAD
jgi:NTE family protein